MKSDKLKKLLNKIKKLRKLKKSNKIKKVKKSQNLRLSADIESLKQKIKNQELQLSQMKYPQQAPISTVSSEKMGIGQQNALNQANLETIQKNIETKLQTQQNPLLLTQQPNNKYSDIIDGIESGKYKIKQTKFGMAITNPSLYKKPGPKAKLKPNKSIDAVTDTSGITSKINTDGSTPQNPIYKYNDSAGISPEVKFEEKEYEYEIPLKSNDLNYDDLQEYDELFETNTDQTINITKDKSNQNDTKEEVKKLTKLTKAQKKMARQTKPDKDVIQVVKDTNSSVINSRGTNIKIGINEANMGRLAEQKIKDDQEINELFANS